MTKQHTVYLDETLSFEERARDLVSRMTLKECADQMVHPAGKVDRLQVPDYNWWNEALHGVARAGMATVFPQSIGMAASFDPELLKAVSDIISTEGRAKYNEYQKKGDHGIFKGLTFWSPNINIFRDPRWGRGQETFGEDPCLTSSLGTAFVEGLQGDDPHYLKAAACAKHFAVHSGPEAIRHEFDAKVNEQELSETYLPAFHDLVDAGVEGFMGAYNRVNGEPACGSQTLLLDILRKKWGFKGYITSDCGAIFDFHAHHKCTDNATESVALAVHNTCDLNCGDTYEFIQLAVEKGLLSEEDVRESCVRLMTTRMKLGMFDEKTPWDTLNYRDLDSDDARRLNRKMAAESLVLLKNDGILPLDPTALHTILVTGPNADSKRVLTGNYHGTANEGKTVLEALRAANPHQTFLYSEGCQLFRENEFSIGDRLTEVRIMADYAELIIAVVGLDETIEGEEGDAVGDKENLLLPENQQAFLKTVSECGKPYIIINMTGSAIDLGTPGEKASAIIHAWYPGAMGGEALAALLFGAFSPSGKLPLTFYRNETRLPDFTDYSMKDRTYKFFTGTPLYPFGYGLSYTHFTLSDLRINLQNDTELTENSMIPVSLTVTNDGTYTSDTVVQFYVKTVSSRYPMNPVYRLAGFQRVSVPAGEAVRMNAKLRGRYLASVSEDGTYVFEPGCRILYAGTGQPDARTEALTGETSIKTEFTL